MRIMFFGIHPDDIELGCGGTVALCVDQGHEVTLVDLTRGESSSNGSPEERAAEASAAAAILGCETRLNLGLPDTAVAAEDSGQLRAVAGVLRDHQPEIVVLPNADDPHPDHASGAALIQRAVYLCGIHGYPTASKKPAWKVKQALVYSGRREVRPDIVVNTTATFERKMRAAQAHRTQFDAGPGANPTPLNAPGFLGIIEARDREAGFRIGAAYGEAFHSPEAIAIADLGVIIAGMK